MKNHANTSMMLLLNAAEKPKNVVSIATRGNRLGYVLIRHQLSGAELAAFEDGAMFSRNNLTRLEQLDVPHSLLSVIHAEGVTSEQRHEELQELGHRIASALTHLRQTDVAFSAFPVVLNDPEIALPGFPGFPEVPMLGTTPHLFG